MPSTHLLSKQNVTVGGIGSIDSKYNAASIHADNSPVLLLPTTAPSEKGEVPVITGPLALCVGTPFITVTKPQPAGVVLVHLPLEPEPSV